MRNRLFPILAVLFVSFALAACAAGIGKDGPYAAVGENADNVATGVEATGAAVTAAGVATGQPWLIGLGALLSTAGATCLAYRADKKNDEAPFVPADAASMDAAKKQLDAGTTLKPVGL